MFSIKYDQSEWTRGTLDAVFTSVSAIRAQRILFEKHFLLQKYKFLLIESFDATIVHVLWGELIQKLDKLYAKTYSSVVTLFIIVSSGLVWWNVQRLTAHSACFYWASFDKDMLNFKKSVFIWILFALLTWFLNVTEVHVFLHKLPLFIMSSSKVITDFCLFASLQSVSAPF